MDLDQYDMKNPEHLANLVEKGHYGIVAKALAAKLDIPALWARVTDKTDPLTREDLVEMLGAAIDADEVDVEAWTAPPTPGTDTNIAVTEPEAPPESGDANIANAPGPAVAVPEDVQPPAEPEVAEEADAEEYEEVDASFDATGGKCPNCGKQYTDTKAGRRYYDAHIEKYYDDGVWLCIAE